MVIGRLCRHWLNPERGFDRLSPNGERQNLGNSPSTWAPPPFTLSLSKGLVRWEQGFDRLSPNGEHQNIGNSPST